MGALKPASGASGPPPFWEQPLETLDRAQWEALCDGCGKCCLHKLEDDESGQIYFTNIACRLLDTETARCKDYRNRRMFVPDCTRLARANIGRINWLPESCAYKLRADGKPLPEWHYLRSGDYSAMHRGGHSIAGRVIPEDEAGPAEHHILDGEI